MWLKEKLGKRFKVCNFRLVCKPLNNLTGQAGLEALARSIYSDLLHPTFIPFNATMQAAQTGFRPDIESFQTFQKKEKRPCIRPLRLAFDPIFNSIR
jgi:hypothetical protein